MSLLSMVTQVCRRIGITAPNAVYSSADPQIIQLLARQRRRRELSSRYPWQSMRRKRSFTTVATESQGNMTTLTGADFRYIVNETFYNRSLRRPVFGPLSDDQWQNLKDRCRSMARGINTGFAGIRCFYSGSCCGAILLFRVAVKELVQ